LTILTEIHASDEAEPSLGLKVGVDLVNVAEVASSVAKYGSRYLQRLFTKQELADTAGSAQVVGLAARFAAKEATMKILEPDLEIPEWRSIEVRRWPGGRCTLVLHDASLRLAKEAGLDHFALSMSHEGSMAVAVVIATSRALLPDDGVEVHRSDARLATTRVRANG
jgi:holo-[acyl-carrier protein] synthase